MRPALASVRRGRSSFAIASSSGLGSASELFTSRSVTSEGSTSSFACATQRALKSSTVCCKSTPLTATYCAPATSLRITHTVMGALACGPCNTTGPREMTAQSSRAKAAPLLNALLGCAHGAIRPQQTGGVRVAPDAAQEHAASSATERSGTLAEAEAATRAQARRESSRRGAQRSCYPLVYHGTRHARGQRAAWRRSAAQKRLRRFCTSEACCGSERQREWPGATHAVQNESHTTQGVSTAHRRLFNTGLQPERLSLNRTLGVARCSAAEAAEHSAHTVQLCEG